MRCQVEAGEREKLDLPEVELVHQTDRNNRGDECGIMVAEHRHRIHTIFIEERQLAGERSRRGDTYGEAVHVFRDRQSARFHLDRGI